MAVVEKTALEIHQGKMIMAEVTSINPSKLDLKKVEEDAAREIREEKTNAAKKRIKDVLIKIEAAKGVVANLEREKDDLLASISEGN